MSSPVYTYGPILQSLPESERGVDCEDCGGVIFQGLKVREVFREGWEHRHFSHDDCIIDDEGLPI